LPIIQSEIIINGKRSELFTLTQNYNKRLEWDPFLIEAKLIGGSSEVCKGARAWCVARNGVGMETEYIVVNEPSTVAIKMITGPYFIEEFAGTWRFMEIKESVTRVVFRYYFKSRYKILEWFLRLMLRYEMNKRLVELKIKYEQEEMKK